MSGPIAELPKPDLQIKELLEDIQAEIPDLVGIAVVLEYTDQFEFMTSGHIMSLLGGSVRLTRYLNDILDGVE